MAEQDRMIASRPAGSATGARHRYRSGRRIGRSREWAKFQFNFDAFRAPLALGK